MLTEVPTNRTSFYESPASRQVLYHADAVQLLPELPDACADAVITDMPYSSGGRTHAERVASPASKYCHDGKTLGRPVFTGDNRDARSLGFWATLWLVECQRLVADGGYVLLFTDWRQLPLMTDVLQAAGFVWRGVISWNKGSGARAPHKGYFRHQCEYLVWGTNGPCPKAEHAGPFPGCITEPVRQTDKFHMTGKPTALMRQLVQVVPPGATVLDPFAGSGTTAVACELEGRRCISIEKERAYADIAAQRIADTVAGTGAN